MSESLDIAQLERDYDDACRSIRQLERNVQDTRARVAALTAENERLTGLLDSPGSIATPWPTRSVLTRLADAADHLLRDHNCDHHGYECLNQAVAVARAALPSSRETTDG